MEWNWLHSLFYGLISGFAEFLPVSAEAHSILFQRLTGVGNEIFGFRLICHLSILLALLVSCRPQLEKIRREKRIAAMPSKRRKRQPDLSVMLDMRVLKMAAIPTLIGFVGYLFFIRHGQRLWILSICMALNGILLYIPLIKRSGNKESQTMSALDSLIFGIGSALGAIPGLSRLGAGAAFMQLRGADRRYALDMCLLLSVPALAILIGFDFYFILTTAGAMAFSMILLYILAAGAAFAGAYFGIMLMRFLAVNIGFSDCSYYCWGAALLTFILYLTI